MSEENKKLQLIGFSLGQEYYAVKIEELTEIVKPPKITKIPSTPDHILGVINLRGEILPVVDVKRKLRLEGDNQTGEKRILMAKFERIKVGMLVESVSAVFEVDIDRIQPPLSTWEEEKALWIEGEVHWENRLFGILNLKKLLELNGS